MNQLTILGNICFRKFEYYACLGLLLSSNQYRNEEDKTNRKPQSMCH